MLGWRKRARAHEPSEPGTTRSQPGVPPGVQTVTVPFNPPLKGGADKEYTGGISDAVLHGLQTEAGHEGIHTPTWGKNAEDYNVEQAVKEWHDVQSGLVSHEYRRQLQELDEVVEPLSEETDAAEEHALATIDETGDLELEQEGLHLQMADEGLEPPSERRDWPLGLKLAALVIADLGLLSVAYQVLAISNNTFLGIPFLSETGLAASGAVVAVVLLAHLAGQELRKGIHHMNLAASQAATERKGS